MHPNLALGDKPRGYLGAKNSGATDVDKKRL